MKIQLASDLHLEHIERRYPGERLIEPAPECDVLVLAGDIHNGARGVELFAGGKVPVVYVAGNHEFYGRDWMKTRSEIKSAARGTNVQVLDRDVAVIGGVRFLGCTLWTDFRQRGHLQSRTMAYVERRINDFVVISTSKGAFRAQDALDDHEQSVEWLDEQLAMPFEGPTVVVTHHGPHPLSIHPRYIGDPLNGAFVSDLTPLVMKATTWLHGHVHDSFDYRVGPCRVVANPRGYVLNVGRASGLQDLLFENTGFQQHCLVEVGTDAQG